MSNVFYKIYRYNAKTGCYSLREVEKPSKFREGLAAFLLGAGVVALGIVYLNSVIGG